MKVFGVVDIKCSQQREHVGLDTGNEQFELDEQETAALRSYLAPGGFLFGEACCGRKGFDAAFRRMIRAAMRSPCPSLNTRSARSSTRL